MVKKELSPLDVYTLLPKTNCRQCGERNCLAFATKTVNREMPIEKCSPLTREATVAVLKRLKELLEPSVKEVVIGVGEHAVKLGGKPTMYRHEFAYFNPTALAIDVNDELSDDEILCRISKVERFCFDYIGNSLKLDLVAVRSTLGNSDSFKKAAKTVSGNTQLPLILCSLDSKILEAGLEVIPKSRPLLYAATKDNWKEMAELALAFDCPLVVYAPNNLSLLKSLTKTLVACGVADIVLDPGTFPSSGLSETVHNFTLIRKAACNKGDKLMGYPILGVPMASWIGNVKASEDILRWREAYLAAMLMVRYADLLILHGIAGWSLLPLVVLRQNLYTDPRKPVAVEPGLRVFGNPNEASPILFTTNFALTYHTVASDLEKANVNAYLLVVDTEGIAVDSAVAGRKLTADKVANALKKSEIESKVKHKKLVIPGKAARLASEIEELSGWQVLIGPKDSSGISKFLEEKWKNTIEHR